MAWVPTMYSLAAFAGAGICALVVGMAWREREKHAAPAFIALMLGFAGWAFLYGVQLGVTTRGGQLAWQRLALPVGGTIPTLWLVFTLTYTNREEWLTRPTVAALAIEPIVLAVVVLTNPVHNLIWQGAAFPPNRTPPVVLLEFGPGYYVQIAYAYLLVTVGLAVLVVSLYRASRLYRTQTTLLLLGALPPFATTILYTLRVDWGPLPALDPTPLVLPIPGLVFGLALYRFDLLARTPVARERILTETNDGFVVLDEQGQIDGVNPAARQVLTAARPEGRPIREVLPGVIGGAEGTDDAFAGIDGVTIATPVDGQRRVYDTNLMSLDSAPGQVGGYVLGLRDVTERQAYEQRLEVANRILRHNLRNKMNVVSGWADRIQTTGTDEQALAACHIKSAAAELIDLSDKARTMATTGGYAAGDDEPDPVNVCDHVSPLVEESRRDYPEATIEWELPPDAWVRVPDATLIEIALGNLLENALEHNDAESPRVCLTVDQSNDDGGRTRIQVSDNGPGIPSMEQDVLEAGTETPLHHGQGLGLWLVYWCITMSGGDISFDANEPRGSIVTLTLQSCDPPSSTPPATAP